MELGLDQHRQGDLFDLADAVEGAGVVLTVVVAEALDRQQASLVLFQAHDRLGRRAGDVDRQRLLVVLLDRRLDVHHRERASGEQHQ
jgi:hypothetical protein